MPVLILQFIGFGVFTARRFERGNFLLHYAGDLLSLSEAKTREKKYNRERKGSYMYYFYHDAIQYW